MDRRNIIVIIAISMLLTIELGHLTPIFPHSFTLKSSASSNIAYSSDKLSNKNSTKHTNNNKPTSSPPILLAFPPMHCIQDEDCIGKNTSSKIFYDPNGRCDIRKNICICSDSKRFKRIQIKVNIKTTTTTTNTANAKANAQQAAKASTSSSSSYSFTNNNSKISANSHHHHPQQSNQQPQPTVVYVTKCVQEDSQNADLTQIDETVSLVFRPHYYGQPCDDDRQCSANMICRQLIIPNASNKTKNSNNNHHHHQQQINNNNNNSSSASANLAQMLTANRTKRCRCPIGQHWNKYIRHCEWIHSNTLFQFGLAPTLEHTQSHGVGGNGVIGSGGHGSIHGHFPGPNGGIAAGNNLIGVPIGTDGIGNGGNGGLGQSSSVHPVAVSNIDLKIFEIVLEIAFLLACLLGYKACSSICCKDEQNNDPGTCNTDGCYGSGDERDSSAFGNGGGSGSGRGRELKSDEESILSSSQLKSSSLSSAVVKNGQNSVPNLMINMKGSTTTNGNGNSGGKNKPANSVKQARRMSRKRRMSRFCARATARRNSSSPYGSGLTSGYLTSGQNFRRLSSVSASAISRSSSASTRNLLVKINPSDAAKCLSVSTILAPNNNNNNNNNNNDNINSNGALATGSSSRTSSPCYNCRIYKEVYSPSARCKSCRSSLLSVATSTADLNNDTTTPNKNRNTTNSNNLGQTTNNNPNSLIDFDSLMLMVGGGCVNALGSTDRLSSSSMDSNGNPTQTTCIKSSSSLLSPVYKQKPIRRSEEVGVPPHLRAPYRDSQPFWLK